MINFIYNGEKVGTIPIEEIEKFFFISLLKGNSLPPYSFLFPDFENLKKWNNDFYYINFQSFSSVYKDKKLFVVTPELLYKAYKDEKEIYLDWEDLEKEEVWWFELNSMKKIGYGKFFDLSFPDLDDLIYKIMDFEIKSSRKKSKSRRIKRKDELNEELSEEEMELLKSKKFLEEYDLVNFYYQNEFIASLNLIQVYHFLNPDSVYIWGLEPFMPIFFNSWWINVKELKRFFYLIYSFVAIILYHEGEFLVMGPKFLYNILENGIKYRVDWEDFEKKKVWWQRFNIMYDDGLYKYFDYTPLVERLDKIADKLLLKDRFFNKWFRYEFRSRHYYYHNKEEIKNTKNLLKEISKHYNGLN